MLDHDHGTQGGHHSPSEEVKEAALRGHTLPLSFWHDLISTYWLILECPVFFKQDPTTEYPASGA